jgi:hypothetical protein
MPSDVYKAHQKVDSIGGVAPPQKHDTPNEPTHIELRIQISKRLSLTFAALCILILASILVYKLWPRSQLTTANPFTAQEIASAQFPLYYPSHLPFGYQVDPKSVTEPSAGVLIFTALGPNNEAKIYFSEEARPTKYDVGAFYSKFSNLHEIGFGDGAIAVGNAGDGGTKIASRLTSKTWIIANTNNQAISPSQLTGIMEHMALSY